MEIDLKGRPFYLDEERISWVCATLSRMTMEEKAAQLFCVLLTRGDEEEIDSIFRVMEPGGVTYRPLPLRQAVQTASSLLRRSKIPPLIAANLEKGGSGIIREGTTFGSPLEAAATGCVETAADLAEVCAREAGAVGGNWSFSPIIDIDSNFHNPITNVRTFGSNPARVAAMGRAYTEKLQSLGLAACAKHFPGDGQDERDQHLVTSVNSLDCEEWMETYGKAYRENIEAGVLSVMVGHIMQPAWTRRLNPGIRDEDIMPASLSRELMQGLLRGKLGFNGLISTDATVMAGYSLAMSRRRAIPESVACGADIILFARNLREDYGFLLDGIRSGVVTMERLDEAVTRVLALKTALRLHENRVPDLASASVIVGCERHQKLAGSCADLAITLVKEKPGVLPVTPERYRRILYYPLSLPEGSAACDELEILLRKEGFEVERFEPCGFDRENTVLYQDFVNRYDLALYAADLPTKSNQTVVRINWPGPMACGCGHYIHDIPTVFVSLENPYHLLDFPRVKTYINCYNSNPHCLHQLIEKLSGRSEFYGKNPVDPFCGKWDTRL